MVPDCARGRGRGCPLSLGGIFMVGAWASKQTYLLLHGEPGFPYHLTVSQLGDTHTFSVLSARVH